MFSVQRRQNWIAIAALCVTAFSALFAVKQHVNNGQGPVSKQRYIVQGLSINKMIEIVERIDGEVTQRLPIIDAIGVNISPVQFNIIASNPALNVTQNHSVVSHGLDDANYDYLPTDVNQTYVVEQTGADILHLKGITGSDIGVAIIDSGLSVKYEKGSALRLNSQGKNRVIAKYDAIERQRTWELDDDFHGHGSHVASMIASSQADKQGKYSGMAPDANLISIKAFDDKGRGTYLDVIEGLNWLVENQKSLRVRVVNLSFGAEFPVNHINDPLNRAVEKVWDAGIVVVTSAGNDQNGTQSITVPGSNPFIITVGALSQQLTKGSSAKPEILSWDKQFITRENSHITQSNRDVTHLRLSEDVSVEFGTSQAAAVVSGTAALMLQLEPNLSPDDVKCRLMASANHESGMEDSGRDIGLSNALNAVLSRASGCANNEKIAMSSVKNTEDKPGKLAFAWSQKGSDKYLDNGYGISWYKGENWKQRTALKRWKSMDQDDNQQIGADWREVSVNQGHLEMLINKDVNR